MKRRECFILGFLVRYESILFERRKHTAKMTNMLFIKHSRLHVSINAYNLGFQSIVLEPDPLLERYDYDLSMKQNYEPFKT
jgi:hypothetical protein